ncbi:hypothetical protein LCGC14_2314160, partial [marine sediment metagenome]
DREQVEKLWDATDIPKFPTSYPEIVAERNGEIIGFVAVRYDKSGVLIEPMLCPNIRVYVGLWFALEEVLKKAGVKSYCFRVEPHRVVYEKALWGAEARGIIKSLGYYKGFSWFQRSINGGKLCKSSAA